MKKTLVLSVIVAMLFSICIPTSVMAASPMLSLAGLSITNSTVPEGGSLSLASIPSNVQAAINSVATANNVKGTAFGMIGVDYTGPDADKVVVRFDVRNLKVGQKVTVVHQKADGTYQILNATTYEGYFTFIPGSFSPFGFYVDATPNNVVAPPAGGTTATSPQTGIYQ